MPYDRKITRLLAHLHFDLEKNCWSFSGELGTKLGLSDDAETLERPIDEFISYLPVDEQEIFQKFITTPPERNEEKLISRANIHLPLSGTAGSHACFLEGYFVSNGDAGADFYGTLCTEVAEGGLDQILNFSGDMLAMMDADFRFIKMNNAYAAMFRKTPADLIGLTSSEAFAHDPDHYFSVIDPILRKCLKNIPTHFKQWVEVPEFGKMHLNIQYSPIVDGNGHVEAIAIVCKNDTDVMESLDALQQSEEMLKRTEKIAQLGGWSYNIESDEILWTEQMYEIHGVDEDFAPTFDSLRGLYQEEDWQNMRGNMAKALEGGQADLLFEIILPDGSRKWVRSVTFPDVWDGGEIKQVQGVTQDVTDTVVYEKELETQKIMFETLAETSNDIIARYDRNGRHIYINSAVERYTVNAKEFYIGKTHRESGEPDELCKFWENMIERSINSGSSTVETLAFSNDRGKLLIFDCRLHPELNKDGTVEFLVSTSRDITDRVKSEEELQKLEKLNSLGLLAGGIAHDFNNILTMLFGNVSLAKAEIPENNLAYQNLEKAEEAFERASRLTNQLLTFAKGGSPIKKHIKLKFLIEEVAKFDLSGGNVKLELEIEDDLWDTFADQGQLEQVFTNLVMNAVQAMPDGGLLQIKARNIHMADKTKLRHLKLQPGKHVEITFEDNGEGIPYNKLDHIFDPYFSTKEKGNGLGLATVYSVITKHNGIIDVSSTIGKGTIFSIYLPVSKQEFLEVPSVKTSGALTVKETTPRRVLVMDDEEMIRNLAVSILQKSGYIVEVAVGGEQAIGLYKQSLDERRGYDCIIMDLTIPGGIGGKEAVNEILKLNQDAKVIVSSGYSEDPVMSHFEDYGFKGVLPKPFTPTSMIDVVGNILST